MSLECNQSKGLQTPLKPHEHSTLASSEFGTICSSAGVGGVDSRVFALFATSLGPKHN